jgi:hypothetical protein
VAACAIGCRNNEQGDVAGAPRAISPCWSVVA